MLECVGCVACGGSWGEEEAGSPRSPHTVHCVCYLPGLRLSRKVYDLPAGFTTSSLAYDILSSFSTSLALWIPHYFTASLFFFFYSN